MDADGHVSGMYQFSVVSGSPPGWVANLLRRKTDSTSSNTTAFERRSRYTEDHRCDLARTGVSLGLRNGLDVLGVLSIRQSVEVVQTSHSSDPGFSNRLRHEVFGTPRPSEPVTSWQ
jgi:hypothetical protein